MAFMHWLPFPSIALTLRGWLAPGRKDISITIGGQGNVLAEQEVLKSIDMLTVDMYIDIDNYIIYTYTDICSIYLLLCILCK